LGVPNLAQRRSDCLPETSIVQGELGAKLDKRITRYAAYGLSGGVLVLQNNVVILRQSYGLSDRERGIPNTVNTLFPIASVTKQFTATAILQLEMQGKLSMADPITQYLGPFPGSEPGPTIHHLLTHTSGLIRRGTTFSSSRREDFVQKMKDTPRESAPGERYRYSNAGYGLLAAIVEKVSGQPFDSYLEEHLFRPAGMHCTRFIGDWDENDMRVARGYQARNAWVPEALKFSWFRQLAPLLDPWLHERPEPLRAPPLSLDWSSRSSGGVLTTLGDLQKWEQALRGNTILSAAAKKKLWTPYVQIPRDDWERGKYFIPHTQDL
jgi:CubicO group peptidase (beta-lactamase class C family)